MQTKQLDLNTWVGMALQRAIDVISNRLQSGLAFLATVGSTAPFVGLFGTVWGIYHALTAIGIAGQASIDKVAGPVGEALIMTALGLAVAVPAVLGYKLAGPPQQGGHGADPALRRRRRYVAARPRRPHAQGLRIMSMNVASPDAEDDLVADINTTPLVDVMLVLLIIFLITIPVVIQSVPVELPKERNLPTQTKPENIVIAVNKDGDVFWNNQLIAEEKMLLDRLREVAVRQPQPEIHIRGDKEARYESIGRVVFACQRIGILKIGFITEPPARTGVRE